MYILIIVTIIFHRKFRCSVFVGFLHQFKGWSMFCPHNYQNISQKHKIHDEYISGQGRRQYRFNNAWKCRGWLHQGVMAFNSPMTEFSEDSDISDLIKRMLALIRTQVENSRMAESGFSLDKIMHLSIKFDPCQV